VVSKATPGSILIFHINGRGYHTGEALPRIVHELKGKGYRFISLEELFDSGKVRP
jgi:peptidoglycan/xylan/chitin deacetylase (PgdA/CDA1 family)